MNYSEKVIEAVQTNNLKLIKKYLDLALKNDSEETLFNLANIIYMEGFLKDAKTIYNYLLTKQPDNDEVKVFLAELEIEDGNDIVGLELLHTIQSESDFYPYSLLIQADYYQVNDLPEVSISKLKEAEKILPNEMIIKFGLAELYFSSAMYQEGIHYYKILLDKKVNELKDVIISERIGTSYLMLREYDVAIDYLKSSLKLKKDPNVYYLLGYIYINLTEYQKAIDYLEKAKNFNPDIVDLYLLLSISYEQIHDLPAALNIIKEGLRISEMNVELFLSGAELSVKLNKHDQANEYYKKAIGLDSENEEVLLKYAEYLEYMGEYEQIIELYNHVPEYIQQTPAVNWLLATANDEIENFDLARHHFEEAYRFLNEHLEFLRDYIFFLHADGQRDKMQKIAKIYLSKNPEIDEEISTLINDEFYF